MMSVSAQAQRFSQNASVAAGGARQGPWSEQTLASLLAFYLACIEEEDLRSLTLRLTQHHRSFVSPWDEAEPLFCPEAAEVHFQVRYESDRKLLTRGVAQAGAAERFFYGYPVFLDEEDYLSPLFVMEVAVSPDPGGGFTMRPMDPQGIQVNHHLFRKRHATVEELQLIQDELEREYGSFEARLRAAFEHLGAEPPQLDPRQLDPFPGRSSPRNTWVNRPILFRSERSTYTHHLRYELDALTRYERLSRNTMSTAVALLLGLASTSPAARGAAAESLPTPRVPPIIEVLPLNEHQERCALEGLQSALTVVTGPPGTGKSQVVVDLLASCALAGMPVLFASKNNKAVDVVSDRLRQILGEGDSWVLRFGSREYVERAREEIMSRIGALSAGAQGGPALPPQEMTMASLCTLDAEVAAAREKLRELDKVLRALRVTTDSCRAAQAALPPHWAEHAPPAQAPAISYALVHAGREEARALCGEAPMELWLWLKRLFLGPNLWRGLRRTLETCAHGLPAALRQELLEDVDYDPGYRALARAFDRILAYRRWLDAMRARRAASAELEKMPEASVLAARMQELKERKAALSQEFFRASWTDRVLRNLRPLGSALQRYFNLSDKLRSVRGREWASVLDDLTDAIREVGRFLPVWVVTNLSARRSVPLQPALFDLVVIDEASQCDIASAIPLLFRARRALIIGDPHQLRHISTIREDREAHLARDNGVEHLLGDWSYTRRSLYDVAEAAVRRQGREPIFLAEHYRSHPRVIEFSNRTFYQGRLVLRTPLPILEARLNGQPLGIFWHNVDGRVPETSRSARNDAEVAAAMELLEKWWEVGLLSRPDVRAGVVTPFRLQMEALEEALQARPWWEEVRGRAIVGTAHRFQGDECDVMIFSPVVAPGMSDRLRRWVAETDQLLNVAITRARGALHVVGCLEACRGAGRYLGRLADYVTLGAIETADGLRFDSEAEEQMATLLREMGLWFQPQYPEGQYRFDFLVVSPFGVRYDLEVDGRGHWTSEQLHADEVRDKAIEAMGYKVIRISARDLLANESLVRNWLARIV